MSLRFRRIDSIALASILFVFVSACSAYNYPDDEEPMPQSRRTVIADDGASPQLGGFTLPPADWWREAAVADMVRPTADQVAALDKLQSEQGDEITRMQRDMVVAERDLRTVLESEKPSADAILTAGQRVRTLRDDILGRQLRYLASTRELLTRDQWTALEDAIRTRRRDRMREGGRRGQGGAGRGPYPGRGGRPRGLPGW